MKRVLICGANGLLGQHLTRVLANEYQVLATSKSTGSRVPDGNFSYDVLDITHAKRCREFVAHYKPDIIINAASYSDVDGCESNRELCWQTNVKGVENLAYVCRKTMTMLIHMSTDYVFNGLKGPYSEEDKPNPLGYYGKAKLASENAVRIQGIPYAIIRTSVLYGVGRNVRLNFFGWVYENLKTGQAIRVVTDQYNTPTLVDDLAVGIKKLLEKSCYGLYNMTGPDFINRFQFATTIAEIFELDKNLIRPIHSEVLNQKAKRPLKGGLKIEKAIRDFGYQPRSTPAAIQYLKSRMMDD